MDIAMMRSASLSPDGRYRYDLTRRWGPGGVVMWVMLNPSTADASVDDPTIRRVIGFSKSWGYGKAVVVNLFALRATDPDELVRQSSAGVDIEGPDNDSYIREAMDEAVLIVAAWGAHPYARPDRPRTQALRQLMGSREVLCLGKTREGCPKHPLYLPAITPFDIFWESTT